MLETFSCFYCAGTFEFERKKTGNRRSVCDSCRKENAKTNARDWKKRTGYSLPPNAVRKEIWGRTRTWHCECGASGFQAYGALRKRCETCAKKKRSSQDQKHFYLKTKYNLTPEQFEVMKQDQAGACAICKRVPKSDSMGRTLAVDHCHATGRVRGLLCSKCNQGIGLLQEDPEILKSALTYLT